MSHGGRLEASGSGRQPARTSARGNARANRPSAGRIGQLPRVRWSSCAAPILSLCFATCKATFRPRRPRSFMPPCCRRSSPRRWHCSARSSTSGIGSRTSRGGPGRGRCTWCGSGRSSSFLLTAQLDLALLAPGDHRLDGARAALRRARLLPGCALAIVVLRPSSSSSPLVLHRDLPARPVSLGRRARRPVPESRDARHRVGLLPVSPAGGVERRHAARGLVRALGPAPPRLPVPSRARRLDAVGLLPRHRLHAGDRRGHPVAGAR